MRVKILKSFPFYPDGNTRHEAEQGDSENIPDALIEGLAASGYVEKPLANEPPASVPSEPADTLKTMPIRKGFRR